MLCSIHAPLAPSTPPYPCAPKTLVLHCWTFVQACNAKCKPHPIQLGSAGQGNAARLRRQVGRHSGEQQLVPCMRLNPHMLVPVATSQASWKYLLGTCDANATRRRRHRPAAQRSSTCSCCLRASALLSLLHAAGVQRSGAGGLNRAKSPLGAPSRGAWVAPPPAQASIGFVYAPRHRKVGCRAPSAAQPRPLPSRCPAGLLPRDHQHRGAAGLSGPRRPTP